MQEASSYVLVGFSISTLVSETTVGAGLPSYILLGYSQGSMPFRRSGWTVVGESRSRSSVRSNPTAIFALLNIQGPPSLSGFKTPYVPAILSGADSDRNAPCHVQIA